MNILFEHNKNRGKMEVLLINFPKEKNPKHSAWGKWDLLTESPELTVKAH